MTVDEPLFDVPAVPRLAPRATPRGSLTPAERRELLVAEVHDLSDSIAAHGVMVTGSKGQLVVNPAVALRHAALEAIRRLDVSHPPDPGADPLDEFLEDRAND